MSELINHHFPLTMRTITPLHIGGAQEKHLAKDLDFIQDRGKTYFLDLNKICKLVSPTEVAEYLAGIRQGGLKKCIEVNRIRLDEVATKMAEGVNAEGDIKAFVKNPLGDKPYIPGSSVKGAIRSIVAASLGKPNKNGDNILGRFDSDIFRHVKIGDGQAAQIVYHTTKIFNLSKRQDETVWSGGWKHSNSNNTTRQFNSTGFTTTYECLPVGASIPLSLKISRSDTVFMGNLKEKNAETHTRHFNSVIVKNPLTNIFQVINQKTAAYLKKEIAYLDKYRVSESSSFLEEMQRIQSLIPTDNSYCVFRMAHGSGFHSITGDFQFQNFDDTGFHTGGRHAGKKMYKSRKFVFAQGKNGFSFSPMGFVMWGFEKDLPKIVNTEQLSVLSPIAVIVSETKPEVKPSYSKGIVKDQAELNAVVVVSGSPNQVEVYLTEGVTIKLPLGGYKSPITENKVILVRVNQIDKTTGRPKMVNFSGFKN
jgi:CRISPR/Cas system CSM-associated protein Csm5 (group 7 of RAMP superfamily)